jgi:hypothetical protein
MPDTVNRNQAETMKRTLESIANSSSGVPPQVNSAILDVVTAANYADEALLVSSFNSLLSCLADVARYLIQRTITAVEETKTAIRKGWRESVDCLACEDFDDLKNAIESIIDERISTMSQLRDKMVKKLEERDYKVENAQQLEDAIRDLRQFRQDILKEWPSPNKPPSSLNRQAIAEAREAIARGEKGLRKD